MADDFHPKYNIHIEHGEHIAIGDGATLDASQAEALLKGYRQQVLEETRYVQLAGIPLPRDREGKPIPLQVPLDRVYIRIQALPEAEERKVQRAEQEALEAELRHEEGPQPPGGFLNRLLPHRTPQESPPSLAPDSLSVLRRLGEYFYRRGEVYRAEDRPQPVDPEAALREHGRMVVLGAPGAGKTTLLLYLARRAAEAEAGPIPVLVSLRDYAAYRGAGGKKGLRAFALSEAAGGSEQLRQVLEQATEEGRILWLVDALDEARGWRREAAREAAKLPGQMVLTSRPVGYDRVGLEDLPHFEALALTPQAREKFLHDWFTVLAEACGEDEAWVVQRVGWLQAQLEARPRIRPLTRNPLLLTFLVVLAGEEPARELPATRAALYRQYVEELLMTWEYRRRPQAGAEGKPSLHLGPLSGEAARRAAREGLLRLGWRLHLTYYGGQAEAMPTRRALTGYLEPFLAAQWNLAKGEAEVVAEAILAFWEEAGLLVHWQVEGEDYLAFRHLTFQEYAAARTLANLWKESPRRVWRFLRPRLHHYAWREVLLLMAGLLEDATLLVRKVRRAHSLYERELHRDLFLAAEVAGEGRRVEHREIHRLVRRLSGLLTRWRWWAAQATLYALTFTISILLLWWSLEWPGAITIYLVWTIIIIMGTSSWKFPKLQALLWLPTRAFSLWNGNEREESVKALSRLNDMRTMRPLIYALLKDKWPSTRKAAAEALGERGSVWAIDALIRALGDQDMDVRDAVVKALGKLDNAQVIDSLNRALRDKNLEVRVATADALGKLGNAYAVKPLIHALEDKNKNVRQMAAKALGKLGDARAVEPLIHALGDEDSMVRVSVVEALGELGDARAVKPLLRFLRDDAWLVREAAKKALSDLDTQASTPISQDNKHVCKTAAALGKLGDTQSVELLIRDLEEDWIIRGTAAKALGELGDAQAIGPLIHTLRDKDLWVRDVAVEALGKLGDAAVKPLIRALGDRNDNVREAAAKALGNIGNTRAIEPLILALGDTNWRVRDAVVEALGKLSDAAVEPFIRALGNRDEGVCKTAAEILGEMGDTRAVETLIRALEDEGWRVRKAAAEALGKLGDARAVEPLIHALEDKDLWVRWAVVEALSKLGDVTIEPLIHTLKNGNKYARRSAAEALGKLGDAWAVEPLIRALGDKDWGVRWAAAKALEKLGSDIPTQGLTRRAARALWWRLTDSVAIAAYTALRQVVARLTELEVAALPPSDPLLPPRRTGWQRGAIFASGLLLFWLADLITNLTTNLASEWLGSRLPRGGLGWVALLLALGLGAMTLAEALQHQE